MQINFDQDISRTTSDDRKKKRFRITISASFIIDDDEFIDAGHWGIDEDDVPADEDGEIDDEAMEEQGIEYDCEENSYSKPRDIQTEPVTAEEIAEHLAEEYGSSFEFIDATGREDEFTTSIVEVDDEGKAIVPPQTRNKSESKS